MILHFAIRYFGLTTRRLRICSRIGLRGMPLAGACAIILRTPYMFRFCTLSRLYSLMTAKLCAQLLHLLQGRFGLGLAGSVNNQLARLRNYQHRLQNRQPFGAFRWPFRCASMGYSFGFQLARSLAWCCDPSRYILQFRLASLRMVWPAALLALGQSLAPPPLFFTACASAVGVTA